MHRVAGFDHRAGAHCGSTSLRDLAEFYGWGYDEPTCFGLAGGLGFSYFERPDSPHRMFFGRTPWLETAFFDRLGIDVEHREGDDWPDAWDRIRAHLDADRPVMVFTDLYYLDYYDTGTHFAPHSLLAVGYEADGSPGAVDADGTGAADGANDSDGAGGTVLLADSEFADLQRLPAGRLREAMTSTHVVPLANRFLAVTDPDPAREFAPAARAAVARTADYMLEPERAGGNGDVDGVAGDGGARSWGPGTHGVPGIYAMARDLPSWTDLPDPAWTARFAYQNIERRGTGGGAFRRLFAEFLATAGDAVGDLPADASDRMAGIADDWTALADLLRRASEDDDRRPALLERAGEDLDTIADREASLYRDLRAAL